MRRRLEFFAAQFDFCDLAAQEIEYKSKDTIRLAGQDAVAGVRQRLRPGQGEGLCSQTENGLSVRALMTLLGFAKALTWFRGRPEVSLADVRQVVPWILHEKLAQNPTSPFFDQTGNGVYRLDRVGWIRKAFDLACEEFVRAGPGPRRPGDGNRRRFRPRPGGRAEAEVRKQLNAIETHLDKLARTTKLYAHVRRTC